MATAERHPGRWGLVALGTTLATLALMLLTEPMLAIVWDEGYTLGREERVRTWIRGLIDPAAMGDWQSPAQELVQPDDPKATFGPPAPGRLRTRSDFFARDVLLYFWPFGREEPHGHPPFYAIVGLIGDLARSDADILTRGRFGPILAFSLTAGAIAWFLGRRHGPWAAATAVGAWVFHPHLFAHGHYATVDAILSCLWVGGLIAFAEAVRIDDPEPKRPAWLWVIIFGVLCGWAADSKLTGWFLPLPMIAWAVVRRDRRGLLTLFVGGIVAVVTLYAFNPPWWPAPIDGLRRFLTSNLTRGQTQPIPVMYLGRVYNTPNESLPWHNTIVLTAACTPVGFLLLALIGGVRSLVDRASRSFGTLALGSWMFLLVLRAMPHTPGHDGTRQFLAAFGGLAIVAGLGAGWIAKRFGKVGRALIVAAIAEGVVSVAMYLPVPLSYYGPIVGGLPGATAIGLEPTYFWDALDGEALDWLNARSGPEAKVAFATNPTSWMYLQRTGRLHGSLTPEARDGEVAWYVIQNRPGALPPRDKAMIREREPAFVVRKFGVPLLWIFPAR